MTSDSESDQKMTLDDIWIMPNGCTNGIPIGIYSGYALPHMIMANLRSDSESDQKMTQDDIWIMPNDVLTGNPNLAFTVVCTATHHQPTQINNVAHAPDWLSAMTIFTFAHP